MENNLYKVFKMDDFDWVVAKSEEEAIAWYEKEYGESVDRDEVRECDLENEGQYTNFTDEKRIAELEAEDLEEVVVIVEGDSHKRSFGSLMKCEGEWYIKVPFKDMLPVEETEPCVTASTEW